jgi:hypothetical protein
MTCLAYGEPMPASGSQARSTPNLTSSLVIGAPFWKNSPFLRVKVQVLLFSDGRPVSVARSPTIFVPSLCGPAASRVVRVR